MPEFRILKSCNDSVSFCKDAVAVVWFLYLDKDKRKAINKEGDIRAKLFAVFLAGELGNNVELVSIKVFEVDDFKPRGFSDSFVEFFSKILVIKEQV